MEVPIVAWLLQGIPESIACAAFMLSVGTKRLCWKHIFTIGLIQAILAYIVRLLPITFGVHTVILIIVLALLSFLIGKIEFRKSIILANITILIVALTECITQFIMVCLGISLNEGLSYYIVRTTMGYPQVLVLFVLALMFSKESKRAKPL